MVEIKQQLRDFLNTAGDWDKLDTPIPGVFVVKIPATKNRVAMLQIELNPIMDDGKHSKRRGLYVANKDMLIRFSELLADDNVYILINEVEDINPDVTKVKREKLKM